MSYSGILDSRFIKLMAPFAIVTVWVIVTSSALVSPLFLPRPHSVIVTIGHDLREGILVAHLAPTFVRLIVGCIIGCFLGIVLGATVGYAKWLFRTLEPTADFFRSIPIACLFPLFLVIFGVGDRAKIATVAWSSMFVVLLNTASGVSQANCTRLMVAKTMGATQLNVFLDVLIPEALTHIIAGIRTGVSLGLIVVLMTEMFMGTEVGLGRYIFDASLVYKTSEMYAGIIIAGFLGYGLNRFFVWLEHRIIHWKGR